MSSTAEFTEVHKLLFDEEEESSDFFSTKITNQYLKIRKHVQRQSVQSDAYLCYYSFYVLCRIYSREKELICKEQIKKSIIIMFNCLKHKIAIIESKNDSLFLKKNE